MNSVPVKTKAAKMNAVPVADKIRDVLLN